MLLSNPLSVDEAQSLVDQDGPYYLKSLKVLPEEVNSLEKFIETFFRRYNATYATLRLSDDVTICSLGRSRSVLDVARICKYYFPDSNVVTVRQIFFDLSQKGLIGSSICQDVKRRVFYYGGSTGYRDTRDEFGWKFNKRQTRQPGQEPKIKKKLVSKKEVAPKRIK